MKNSSLKIDFEKYYKRFSKQGQMELEVHIIM